MKIMVDDNPPLKIAMNSNEHWFLLCLLMTENQYIKIRYYVGEMHGIVGQA